MPSRYYLLQDLPHVNQIHYSKKVREILELRKKIRELNALENYFSRNLLFELKTIIQQKRKKIQRKLRRFIHTVMAECALKLRLYLNVVTTIQAAYNQLQNIMNLDN
jgi:hypothetical protein